MVFIVEGRLERCFGVLQDQEGKEQSDAAAAAGAAQARFCRGTLQGWESKGEVNLRHLGNYGTLH